MTQSPPAQITASTWKHVPRANHQSMVRVVQRTSALNTPNSCTQFDSRQWTLIVITPKKQKKETEGKGFFGSEEKKKDLMIDYSGLVA